ncbi:MAG: SGNH/GDSL hydrolase family protein [Actinomycetes bacterium]
MAEREAATPATAAAFGRRWRSRALATIYPPLRRTYEQMNDYAARWDASNREALASEGPLWVVLGDSTGQGVGASRYDAGWVGQVRDSLAAGAATRQAQRADAGGSTRDPELRTPLSTPPRVLNLSQSGARLVDAVESQWPEVGRLGVQPALVTAVIGANDLTHTSVSLMLQGVATLARTLPAGAVIATLPRGWHERKALVVNEGIRQVAADCGLRVADLWQVTGAPWRGYFAEDRFHPNDRGYARWAQAVLVALTS